MISFHALTAKDSDFKSESGQTKDTTIGMLCFYAKHTSLRRKSKNGLASNQNNVSADCCFNELAL
jgi:hypothetical protein